MIERFYIIYCDFCGYEFGRNTRSKKWLVQHINDSSDGVVIDGRHYCFSCATKIGLLIPCYGFAHKLPMIDNCPVCAPRWGWILNKDIKNEIHTTNA